MNISRAKELIDRAIHEGASELDLSSKNEVDRLSDIELETLLPGILKIENLTKLNLNDNRLSDVSFLGKLKKLTRLNLNDNRLRDGSFIRQIKNLEGLYLNSNQLHDFGFLEELKSLKSLNLSLTNVRDISFLSKLKNLEWLSIYGNYLNDFSVIGRLKNLNWLDLSQNGLTDISALQASVNLKSLYLNSNELTDIAALQNLNNLNCLTLRFNKIEVAYPLEELKGLTVLDLGHNKLSDVLFLKELINLTSLNLDHNELSNASVTGGLINLDSLDLGHNVLSDVSFLKKLKKLTYLNLHSSEFSDITILQGLNNLKSLHLSGNKISDASALKGLNKLESVDLANNNITDVSFINELKDLTSLDLRSNKISKAPDLKGLKKLTALDLGSNKLKKVPFLAELKGLTSLNLGYNKLSDVSFLKELTSLTSLDMGGNPLTNISLIGELKRLKSLDLSGLVQGRRLFSSDPDLSFLKQLTQLTELNLQFNNNIADFSFFQNLTSLIKLDLSFTKFKDFSLLLKLNYLEHLDLGYNDLWDVSFLSEITGLKSLDLSGNNITDLSFLKGLIHLTSLRLSNIDTLSLPKKLASKFELDKRDISELVSYYEQLESEGSDFIREAKVLIVGEPMAGKTTLFRKLRNHNYLPQKATPKEKESTIGVDIKLWEFPFDEENLFKAHLWDFGGQEKQYVLHQYFFTERSLYILLADDRRESGNFNYWFEIIATLGSGCPVVVVLNEINSKVKSFDISVYRREFNEKIRDIEEKSVNFADNSDGRFVSLVNDVKAKLRSLEHIGKPLPKTWVRIRRDLEGIAKPIISIDEYYGICETNRVNNSEYRNQILEYLHDLGIALNYKYDDNLRNKLILKPNWVIDALYAALRDEKIIRNAGKFGSDDVFALWGDYTADEKTILLQLMQKGKFEVAYKLINKNAYIAPILLPEIAPEYHFNEIDSLQIHFEYAFKPKGIISRLIVRFHENIVFRDNGEQIVWKKGVLLRDHNSFARIIEFEQSRKITVTVSGPSPLENRTLLTILSTEIKRIHRDWFEDRLKFEEKLPCICEVCKSGKVEPYFYELREVESYYEMNLELICGESVKARKPQYVDARQLLEGVYILREGDGAQDRRGNFFVNGDLYFGNIDRSFQGATITHLNLQERLVDEMSLKINDSQRNEMESLADKIIARIEAKESTKLNNAERKELEKAKKGKWETKLKFVFPLIPKIPFLGEFFPSASLETTRTITPDEYISTVRKGLYGDDLQMNILNPKDD